MTLPHRFLLAAALVAAPAAAQTAAGPADSTLAAITERGRYLAAYDRAAWLATDVIRPRIPDGRGIEGFLAVRKGTQWEVMFGRLTAAGDTLFLAARATSSGEPAAYIAAVYDVPRIGDDTERRAFLAIRTAGRELGGTPREFRGPYNTYVMPRPDGDWWVWFLPGQTQPGVYPHGADFRYVVSADGRTVRAKHQMHRALLQSRIPEGAVAGTHTVITEDLPQDSDVFLVLARSPKVPELVVTATWDFEVHPDGRITWKPGVRSPKP